jgi:CDP-diacylglycerol--glycerol-3-phosphate 3-phosphatidyltransferase
MTAGPVDRACRRVALAGAAAVAAAALAVAARRAPAAGGAFLLLAGPAWLVVAGTLWRARGGAPAGGGLGAATHLTLLRGLLVSLVAGFALLPASGVVRWLPAGLYTAAAVADRMDGILARRLGLFTPLGAQLDGATDALGLLVAPLVAVTWGRLPPWYLAVGGAYYAYEAGIWWRRRRGLPAHPERVLPKPATRFFAGAQMVLVCVALAPVLDPAVTRAAGTLLMAPTLALFGRDWLIVIGRSRRPGVAAAAR